MRGDASAFAEATFLVVLVDFACFFDDDVVAVDDVAAYEAGAASRATDTTAEVASAVNWGRPKNRGMRDSIRNMI
ncbi:hypothetical protein D769_19819 [Cupriavidus sp. HMR-1]|nr:hypothetical protein D769_19819 [Cupriavidus sp. HMR-1]